MLPNKGITKMTFGEYWQNVKDNYDSILIEYPDGEHKFILTQDNSEVMHQSKVDLNKINKYNDYWENHTETYNIPKYAQPGQPGYFEIYYEERGWKLNFHFPYEQEIFVDIDHIMAETIDMPGEKLKLTFYKTKKTKLLN